MPTSEIGMIQCWLKMFAELTIVANVGGNDGLVRAVEDEMITLVEKSNMVQENGLTGKSNERGTHRKRRAEVSRREILLASNIVNLIAYLC